VFIFLLQLREAFVSQAGVYLFSVASALVWLSWVVKVVLSRRYKPWTEPVDLGTSVIIPVVDEPLDLFREVLSLIVEQEPTEVIVVINGKRNTALENVCAEFPAVQYTWTPIAGKRNAVKVGVAASTQPITVLVDSDTIWTTYADDNGVYSTLPELIKPFADPTVGGVTTRQRILDPERAWLTRWADWLENTRALYSMPAQSALGQIGCLPGRTIAFRREILVRAMDGFMHDRFLGIILEVSDDRTLTNEALKQGYRTVYQFTSLVYTDAPLKLRKLFKQQLRWARGSQYNTLRMLPWMIGHAPMLAMFFTIDILLPFILVGATVGWFYRGWTHTGVNFYQPLLDEYPGRTGIAVVIALMVLSSWCSALVRQSRHLAYKPTDALRLPVFIMASTIFLMPVRILGFVRMAHVASWGTRAGAYGSEEATNQPEHEPTVVTSVPLSSTAPLADRLMMMHAPQERLDGHFGDEPAPPVAALPMRPHAKSVQRPLRAPRHRPNLLVAIPYLIAVAIFALEALAYV
jgi:hyaluronan synthase